MGLAINHATGIVGNGDEPDQLLQLVVAVLVELPDHELLRGYFSEQQSVDLRTVMCRQKIFTPSVCKIVTGLRCIERSHRNRGGQFNLGGTVIKFVLRLGC